MYLLGDDVFLRLGTFKHETYIHIGRYKKFSSVSYSSSEGVFLTPRQFIALIETKIESSEILFMNSKSFDFTLSDSTQAHELCVRISPAIEHNPFQMDIYSLADCRFLFTHAPHVYNNQLCDGRISLNYTQWCQLFTHSAVVIESAIAGLYTGERLYWTYKLISRSARSQYCQTFTCDQSFAHNRLREIFIATVHHDIMEAIFKRTERLNPYPDQSLNQLLYRNQLLELFTSIRCHRIKEAIFFQELYNSDDERKLFHFNLSVLELNFVKMVENFYDNILSEPSELRARLEYHATSDFFITLNPLEIISQLRDEICFGVEPMCF